MDPVRQNPIQRTVSLFIRVCIALCTTVAHNIAQNRPDSFPPYPPDNHHCSVDVYLREGGTTFNQISVKISVLGSYTLIVAPMGWNLAWRSPLPCQISHPSAQRVAPAGQKNLKIGLLSNLNTGALHCAQCWLEKIVVNWSGYQSFIEHMQNTYTVIIICNHKSQTSRNYAFGYTFLYCLLLKMHQSLSSL